MKPIICLLMSVLWSYQVHAQQYFEVQYPKVWERATAYTMAVADQMPEHQYTFKPEEGGMSFGEQLLHIVNNISSLTERISGESRQFYDSNNMENLSKAEIMTILENANRYVGELIAGISREELDQQVKFRRQTMTKENLFYLLRDHQAHHRAQCIVYLRLAGVKAPPYVGW